MRSLDLPDAAGQTGRCSSCRYRLVMQTDSADRIDISSRSPQKGSSDDVRSSKQMTSEEVLFMLVDIASSTHIISRLGDERAYVLFSEFFRIIRRWASDNDGAVEMVNGDEILMSWRAEPSCASHQHAKSWSQILDVVLAFQTLSSTLQRSLVPHRVAIHKGDVLCFDSTPRAGESMPFGLTVFTTFRAENLAKEMGLTWLITEDTIADLEENERNSLQYLGEFQARGLQRTLGVYTLQSSGKTETKEAGLVEAMSASG